MDEEIFNKILEEAKKDGIEKYVVGGVVKNPEGKYLLLERPSDDFMGGINELPSGKVEEGETLKDALLREIKEETGQEVGEIIKYLGHFDYVSGSGKKCRQFNFLVTLNSLEITLTEHIKYYWSDAEEEPFSRLTEEVKKIVYLAG